MDRKAFGKKMSNAVKMRRAGDLTSELLLNAASGLAFFLIRFGAVLVLMTQAETVSIAMGFFLPLALFQCGNQQTCRSEINS